MAGASPTGSTDTTDAAAAGPGTHVGIDVCRNGATAGSDGAVASSVPMPCSGNGAVSRTGVLRGGRAVPSESFGCQVDATVSMPGVSVSGRAAVASSSRGATGTMDTPCEPAAVSSVASDEEACMASCEQQHHAAASAALEEPNNAPRNGKHPPK